MAVIVKKQTFVSRGKEFDSEADAIRHDKLQEARDEYQQSRKVFQTLLAESQKTADGYAFTFGLFHDYYFICNVFAFPDLRRVSFLGWNFQMQDDEAGVSIREDGDGKGNRWFRLSELYYDEFAARRALAVEQEKRLQQLVGDANAIRSVVGLPLLSLKTGETKS